MIPDPDESLRKMMRFAEEGKMGDIVLYFWSQVEVSIDEMFIHAFGFHVPVRRAEERRGFLREVLKEGGGSDFTFAKVRLLLGPQLAFGVRYRFLKENGFFEAAELKAIEAFQKERNKLFHGDIFRPAVLGVGEKDANRMMDIALDGANFAMRASVRAFKRGYEGHVHSVNREKNQNG